MRNFAITSEGQALTATPISTPYPWGGPAGRGAAAQDVVIHNPGPQAIRVLAGAADVVATALSMLVPPNSLQAFAKGSATHIAAICDSGSQAYTVWLGDGALPNALAGAGGDLVDVAAGRRAQATYEAAPAGYSQQFGINVAGMPWQYKLVTSDASGLNIANGPAILGGIYLIAAGTMAGVYDSATAAGNMLVPSTAATVHFNGQGVTCPNGITCDWTSGTWLVLYRAAA